MQIPFPICSPTMISPYANIATLGTFSLCTVVEVTDLSIYILEGKKKTNKPVWLAACSALGLTIVSFALTHSLPGEGEGGIEWAYPAEGWQLCRIEQDFCLRFFPPWFSPLSWG